MVIRPGLVSAVVAGLPLEIPVGTNKTVAVVDDDPMMLDVLSRILPREEFDPLVTDYAMPDMQGRELAEPLRQRLPLILCGSINP